MLLAVETSCDETGIALFEYRDSTPVLLGELLASQVKLHEQYGGVVPELAAREHLKSLPLLVDSLLSSVHASIKDLTVVACTRGPGLKGCLLMGHSFSKGICVSQDIPLVGVNHIEGHLLAPFLDEPELQFPYLALVVSGGHTELVWVTDVGAYAILARTIDDAAGEAFDKSASLLGFPYPGGASLASLADTFSGKNSFVLPKVMREREGFSFSGLKTAISQLIAKNDITDEVVRCALAHAVQESIIDVLVHKTQEAVKITGAKRVVVTGGVAANTSLRAALNEKLQMRVFAPKIAHCVDNGAMIGYVGALRYARGEKSDLSEGVLPKWRVESL